jgi:beta-galactosidase
MFIFATNSEAKRTDYKPFEDIELNDIMPSQTRYIKSLSGKWRMSYDSKDWKTVNIPYSEPGNQVLYFQRTLKIERNVLNSHSWHLYFLGIDDEVEIYINDRFLGRYFGGLTPFMVRLNPKMFTGETNRIMLKVIPSDYGARQVKEQNIFAKKVRTGALREILLIGTPHIWMSDIKYRLKFNSDFSKCQLYSTVKVSSGEIERLIGKHSDSVIYNKNKINIVVEPSIRRKSSGEIVATATPKEIEIQKERTRTINFDMTVSNPILWEVSSPELYSLTLKITKNGQMIDELSVDVGFRDLNTAQIEGQSAIFLNGKEFVVKGVDYLEDYYHTNSSLSPWRMEKDILNLKTLGANLLRIKYAHPNPYFLKLCNKHGLLVLIDIPVYDIPNPLIASDEIKVRMKNIAERMINAYATDPSVLGWGLYESVQENSEEVLEYENYILPYLKRYSDNLIYKTTQLFSNTINSKNVDFIILKQTGMRIDLNLIKKALSRAKSSIKDKPILFNFGMPVQPENHNGYSDPMSIEAQANYLFNLYYLSKNNQLAGSIIWSYNDYQLHNPLLLLNNNNKLTSTSGLMDRSRQQRLSFTAMQALFNNEKDPLFYAGSYTESTPVTFIIYGIIISIILILLINRFKRFREYLYRSIFRPYNFYADIRDQRIMSLVQTYILGLVISFTLGIFFSSILYFYRTSEITQYILMLMFPAEGFQEILYSLIWIPELLIVIITIIFFAIIFILSLFIKIASIFIRARIFYNDTYTITIWAGTPILVLLPLAIILNRLLVFSPNIMWLIMILLAVIIIWVFMRLLRSIAVVFDVRTMHSYLIGLGILTLIMIIVISIYHIKFSIISYTQYLFDVLLKM